MSPLRLGLPKGRILDQARTLFEAAGVDLSPLDEDQRRLVHRVHVPAIGDLEVLVLRATDVAAYVEHGACALGVAGYDVIVEQRPDVLMPVDLGLGRCRMCLCGLPDHDPRTLETPRVASKYAHTARAYFLSRGTPAEIIELSGNIEIAPLVGLADGVVDLVETGETLRKNGLVEIETLFEVTSRLVVNRAALRLRMREVRWLLSALEGALEAPEEAP